MRRHLIVICALALPTPLLAQSAGEDGLPLPPAAPGEALEDELSLGRALARRLDDRLLGVRDFDVTAADLAVLAAPDPQAALIEQSGEARARTLGSGLKLELGGLTVVRHTFPSQADAVAHAGGFLHKALVEAVVFPALALSGPERTAQLVELSGHHTLLLWGPLLDDPARAARALELAREVLGVKDAPGARALITSDHVQVTLLRPDLPSLLALREALDARQPGTAVLDETRDGLHVRARADDRSGRLEISRADPERARALRQLALPVEPPAPQEAPPTPGVIESLQRDR